MAGIRFNLRRPNAPMAVLAALLLLAFAPLSGCSDESVRNTIDTSAKKAEEGLKKAENRDLPAKRYNPLVVSDKIWAGNTAVRMQRGLPFADRFEGDRGITLVSSTPMTIADIANLIAGQTGIPVYLSDPTLAAAPSQQNGGASFGGGQGNSSPAPTMTVSYQGPLSGLLERLAASFGVSWNYNGASIIIKRFETRVFTIEALPGSAEIAEGMQDDSGGSSSGGGSSSSSSITQNSKFSLNIKYWDELGQVVNAMLAGTGNAVISPSLGTITVTTSPEIMRMVADYIAKENQKLSRQIAVNVEIYTVDLQEGMDFNIAFSTALKGLTSLSGNISAGVKPPAEQSIFGSLQGSTTGSGGTSTTSNAAALSVAILNPNSTGQITDVFSALSAIGDTTKIARFPLITLNNRPVSRRVGQDIAYLASSQTTPSTSSGSGPTVQLIPGTIHQGFTVQLTPRLLDDGRILLQYSLSIVDLLSLTSFSAGSGNSIQTPTTANRIFVQQSVLKSGSTLFLGGADEQNVAQNSQGVGDPFNYLLGGGSSSARTHSMVFFALTPQVVDAPHTEQE